MKDAKVTEVEGSNDAVVYWYEDGRAKGLVIPKFVADAIKGGTA